MTQNHYRKFALSRPYRATTYDGTYNMWCTEQHPTTRGSRGGLTENHEISWSRKSSVVHRLRPNRIFPLTALPRMASKTGDGRERQKPLRFWETHPSNHHHPTRLEADHHGSDEALEGFHR